MSNFDDFFPPFVEFSPTIERIVRTSNTILVSGNRSKLIDYTSGTFTQTFTAAATLGDGWFLYFKNSGSGVITLDPDGSETIDGDATKVLNPDDQALIQCDGSDFTVVLEESPSVTPTGLGDLLQTLTITTQSSALAGSSLIFNGDYAEYLIVVEKLIVSSSGGYVRGRVSTASTVRTASYSSVGTMSKAGQGNYTFENSNAAAQLPFFRNGLQSGADTSARVEIVLPNPATTGIHKPMTFHGGSTTADSNPNFQYIAGGGHYNGDTAAIDGFEISPSGAGTLSCVIYVFGRNRLP